VNPIIKDNEEQISKILQVRYNKFNIYIYIYIYIYNLASLNFLSNFRHFDGGSYLECQHSLTQNVFELYGM